MHGVLNGYAPAVAIGSGTQSLNCESCHLDAERCAYCRLTYVPGAQCHVREAQKAAIEEVAAQRAIAAEGQRKAREEARKTASDEMRGGLHALGGQGFASGQREAVLAKEAKRFAEESGRHLQSLEAKGFVGETAGRPNALGLGACSAAQQLRAPGKSFSREEILAVFRSRKAILVERAHFEGAVRELDALIDIFQRME